MHSQAGGGHGSGGGMGYTCSEKYTEGKIQVLTTRVTDDKCINSVALLSQVWYNRTYQVKILLDKDVEGGYNYIYM